MSGESNFWKINIELNSSCNFNCIHCANRDYDTYTLDIGLIEKLLEDFSKSDREKKVIFTGGEPLWYPDLGSVLDLATSRVDSVKLTTNGYYLANSEFDYLFDYDIGFKVSLDGTKEFHNAIRQNSKSYDNLILSMKKISEFEKELAIRTTVLKQNKDSILDMLHELDRLTVEEGVDIDIVKIWPVRNVGMAHASLMLTPKEYEIFLNELNQGTRDFNPSFDIAVAPLFGMESEFVGGPIRSDEVYRCNLLKEALQVAYNGDVYPCSFVRYPLGNIAEESILKMFSSISALHFRERFLNKSESSCISCDVYDSCGGGCIAETYKNLFESPTRVKDVYCFRGCGE
jgi:radical SAM protein with 4Fe4S-binding SPASM domain